jgi:hypothetical protein
MFRRGPRCGDVPSAVISRDQGPRRVLAEA